MAKALLQILKAKERERIEAHMPAKDAPVLEEDELSSLERFIAAWDQSWLDEADTSRSIEDDGFHPSSLGISHGKCARRNVYLLRGVEKQARFNPRVLRIFGNGHAVHDRLQNSLEKMGIQMESEIKIEFEEPPIRGHADGVLVWDGQKKLIEIKSCSDDVFNNRLKWKKPKDEHFEQANIYAFILGIESIWVIYENKNTQEIKIFEKPRNDTKAQKIIDDWHAQWLCFKDGELPKRPYKPSSPVCAGCDLNTHCYSDPEIGVVLTPYKEKVKQLKEKDAA